MTEDINKILAQKRAWRNAERRQRGERRVKDGTPEDRDNTANVLRAGRAISRTHQQLCTCLICEMHGNDKRPFWFRVLRRIGFLSIAVCLWAGSAQAADGSTIVKIARSQIGYGEQGGNNEGPQVEKYTHGQKVAWCAAFVSWVRFHAGQRDHYFLSARSYWQHYKTHTVRRPEPGDLIVFERDHLLGHVGIVESIQGQQLTTIEGNVGVFPAKVKREKYNINHIPHLMGFVRVI